MSHWYDGLDWIGFLAIVAGLGYILGFAHGRYGNKPSDPSKKWGGSMFD